MADFTIIPPAGHGAVGPVNRLATPSIHLNGNGTAKPAATMEPIVDRVELSDIAQYLDKLRSLPEVRMDRVQELRKAIQSGTYDTPEKFDAALDRMFEELDE